MPNRLSRLFLKSDVQFRIEAMLLVHARVGVSAIHGLGLIANEFIPMGSKIWEFMPGFDLEVLELDFLRHGIGMQLQSDGAFQDSFGFWIAPVGDQ